MEEKTVKKNKGAFPSLLKLLIKVFVIAGACFFIYAKVCVPVRMAGNGMYPSVKDGDLCFFLRTEKEYYVGDVVLYADAKGKEKVGRICAIAGQSVDFPEEGGYLVNGYAASDALPYQTFSSEKGDVVYPLLVGEDQYFIMNDFRSDTSDSRTYGLTEKGEIIGKLYGIVRRRGF